MGWIWGEDRSWGGESLYSFSEYLVNREIEIAKSGKLTNAQRERYLAVSKFYT